MEKARPKSPQAQFGRPATQRVLITGAEGFVGGHLSRLLLGDPTIQLHGIVRDLPYAASLDDIKHRMTIHEADITDRQRITAAIQDAMPDKIFHLAGQAYVPEALKHPLETFNANIMGGLHVLEAVRASFPSIPVLIISSGEVYGMPAAGKMPVDESALLDPHTPYSVSKACVDMLAQQYRSTFRMNVVVARSFNHLGPGQNDMFAGSSFAKQIIEAKLGRREKTIAVGNLENKRDFTDVRDVVRAYVALLSKKLDHAVFNVCSGRPVALREVLDTLIRISGVKMKVTQDPTRIRSVDNPLMYGTAARLTDATGWKPEIPLEKTLADLLAYWETRLKA